MSLMMLGLLQKQKKKIMSLKAARVTFPHEQEDILGRLSSQEIEMKESNFYQKHSL